MLQRNRWSSRNWYCGDSRVRLSHRTTRYNSCRWTPPHINCSLRNCGIVSQINDNTTIVKSKPVDAIYGVISDKAVEIDSTGFLNWVTAKKSLQDRVIGLRKNKSSLTDAWASRKIASCSHQRANRLRTKYFRKSHTHSVQRLVGRVNQTVTFPFPSAW